MKTYQIHLIRNGRTDDSTSGRYIGHTDAILSPEGVAELHRLKEQADYPYVEAVFTSPLKRCTQTAHAIYPEREAIVMRELIEYDFGEYEGKTPEQLADDEGFASWLAGGPDAAPPFGESNAEFSTRVCSCFLKIAEGMMKTNVTNAAIVTHGGVIMTILAAFGIPELPMPEWRTPSGCGYTAVSYTHLCVNSGIDTVGVLTQYQPLELNDYIGNGEPWDLDRVNGGVHILSPYQKIRGTEWYKNTANAIYQNINFIDRYDPEYVVVLSGDHIYKMDYSKMLAYHKEKEAACTIAMLEVPWEEAPRFGLMMVNEDGAITEFEEKPKHPRSNKASMGVYMFTWEKLRQYLLDDEANEASGNDFGHDLIPAMHEAHERPVSYTHLV